ncbi:hypothetical protein IOC51_23285 [Vibrio parahaemolyticus]|uniref:hypothetical protein n=1 Tax=Vibrio parahaemolyticus TaxID=670 RepID=UPI001E4EE45E|nr:hypothetical protein [Vibrio parahaemolyticus]MCD1416950.1 hypothetical protein [Vibrio parahaemolyticus]
MKNLAGNDVSIFLFRFEQQEKALSFVLNEAIAEDLYPDSQTQLLPLIHVCSETLLRYRHRCRTSAIMDMNILTDGDLEVMLSPGLGRYFPDREKLYLFSDAHDMAKILMNVMDRRSQEQETNVLPQAPVSMPLELTSIDEQLETLARERQHERRLASEPSLRFSPLTQDELPNGVRARMGYDHRGECLAFEHDTFGKLGKIVLSELGVQTLMETELNRESDEHWREKQALMEAIIPIISAGLRQV